MKEGFIQALYEAALDEVTRTFKVACYFQTEAPPQKLDSYVKWSLPFHQSVQQYIADPIFVRFKREYIKTFFSNPNLTAYSLTAFIKDAKGIMTECKIDWSKDADAITLFPDEQTWRQHLANNSTSAAAKKDNIIKIELKDPSSSPAYKASGRYEIIIGFEEPQVNSPLAGERWNNYLQNQRKGNAKLKPVIQGATQNKHYRVLHSFSFTTSKFVNFEAIIPMPEQTTVYGTTLSIVNSNSAARNFRATLFNSKVNNWVEAEIRNYLTAVDYEYGMAVYLVSGQTLLAKEAIEKARLVLRESKDKVDESFRELAMLLKPELLFQPATGKIEITALNTATASNQSKKIEFLWIHLPESIQLKISNTSTDGNFGKITIALMTENESMVNTDTFFNTDTSQVIFRLKQPISLGNTEKRFMIHFKIINDFADDTQLTIFNTVDNGHHRYDRPSLKGLSDQTHKLKFILNVNP